MGITSVQPPSVTVTPLLKRYGTLPQTFSLFLSRRLRRGLTLSVFFPRVSPLTSLRRACAEMPEHLNPPARSSPPSRCAWYPARSLPRWHAPAQPRTILPSSAPPSSGRASFRRTAMGWIAPHPRPQENPSHGHALRQMSEPPAPAAPGEPRGIPWQLHGKFVEENRRIL